MKNKKAFTLIELSVVLIILGVVAALAYPSLYGQIERNKAQEAIGTLGFIRSAIESCGVANAGNFTQCRSWTAIGFDRPISANFSYENSGTPTNVDGAVSTSAGGTTGDSYTVIATRTGALSANKITITRVPGSVTCAGAGAYVGFCS